MFWLFYFILIALENHRFPKQSLNVLKDWYESNKEFPFASQQTKKLLAEKANLSIKQVDSWLCITRTRKKDSNNPNRLLSIKNRKLLLDFFNKTIFPNQFEIKNLSNIINKSEKQVNQWFINERYKRKNKLNWTNIKIKTFSCWSLITF